MWKQACGLCVGNEWVTLKLAMKSLCNAPISARALPSAGYLAILPLLPLVLALFSGGMPTSCEPFVLLASGCSFVGCQCDEEEV